MFPLRIGTIFEQDLSWLSEDNLDFTFRYLYIILHTLIRTVDSMIIGRTPALDVCHSRL